MNWVVFCETVMLICFGVSWPVSVVHSLRTKKAGGKSMLFLCMIEFGYVVGLIGKVFFNPSYVIAVYLFNMTFVTWDMVLTLRYRKRDRLAAAASQ
jgi:hypothetical protein